MTTTPEATVDRAALVEAVLRDVGPVLNSSELSQGARDAYADATRAVRDLVAAGDQRDRDLAELEAKRDLLPQAGYGRLRAELEAEGRAREADADARWNRSTAALRESLEADALPTFEPERESLARDELALLLGDARGPAAAGAALGIARSGSREALAVMLRSPFGRSLLEARGLRGRELEQTLSSARTIAAERTLDEGATERERAAAAALKRLGEFSSVRGAASIGRRPRR
jgi:hypothetical protein